MALLMPVFRIAEVNRARRVPAKYLSRRSGGPQSTCPAGAPAGAGGSQSTCPTVGNPQSTCPTVPVRHRRLRWPVSREPAKYLSHHNPQSTCPTIEGARRVPVPPGGATEGATEYLSHRAPHGHPAAASTPPAACLSESFRIPEGCQRQGPGLASSSSRDPVTRSALTSAGVFLFGAWCSFSHKGLEPLQDGAHAPRTQGSAGSGFAVACDLTFCRTHACPLRGVDQLHI